MLVGLRYLGLDPLHFLALLCQHALLLDHALAAALGRHVKLFVQSGQLVLAPALGHLQCILLIRLYLCMTLHSLLQLLFGLPDLRISYVNLG